MSLQQKLEIQSMFNSGVFRLTTVIGRILFTPSETHTAGMTFSYIVIKKDST